MSLAVFFYIEETEHRWCIAESLKYLDLSTSIDSFNKNISIELWKDSKHIVWMSDLLNVDCGKNVTSQLLYERLSKVKFEHIRTLLKGCTCLANNFVDFGHLLKNRLPIRVFTNVPYFIRRVFNKVLHHDNKPKGIEQFLNAIVVLEEYWQKRFDHDTKLFILNTLLEQLVQSNSSHFSVATKLLKAFTRSSPNYIYLCKAKELDKLLSSFHRMKCDILSFWPVNCENIIRNPDASMVSTQNIFPIRLMARDFDSCLLLLKYGVKNPTFFGTDNEFSNIKCLEFMCPWSINIESKYVVDWPLTRTSFLIYEAVIINLNSGPSSKELIRKLWDSIEDPYLTENQFCELLQYCNYGKLKRVWPWYLKYVLDSSKVLYEPRLLLHLSRCAVRKRLNETLSLPDGVNLLSLPKKLKQYLLLENLK